MVSLLLIALANAAGAGTPASPTCAPVDTVSRVDPACAPPSEAAATAVVTVTARASEAGRRRESSLARLETIRTASGAGALAPSELLGAAASRHAIYLDANGLHSTPSTHSEAAGLVGFTGADPFVRMRAAGYRSSYATELIGVATSDGDCVDTLMDTVYHAALLLSRVTQVGLAYGEGAASTACVIDLGAPLAAPAQREGPSSDLVRYPWPGMTVASGTFRPNSENPRPAPGLLPAATAGIPVLVGLRNVDDLRTPAEPVPIEIQRFELRDDRNASVPCVLLADPVISGPAIVADKVLHGAFAVLVPRTPLTPGRYHVLFHATLESGRVIAPAPWDFAVAAP